MPKGMSALQPELQHREEGQVGAHFELIPSCTQPW